MSKRKGHILFVRVVPVLFSTTGDSTQIYHSFIIISKQNRHSCNSHAGFVTELKFKRPVITKLLLFRFQDATFYHLPER